MQIRYIMNEGLSGFRRAKLSMSAAIVTVSISLLLLSLFSNIGVKIHPNFFFCF